MDVTKLEEGLAQLPLCGYFFLEPKMLEFSERVRWVCEQECPMFGHSWACPPGVGTVAECQRRCQSREHCLMIVTVTEVADIGDMDEALATRQPHEEVTNQVRQLMRELEVEPYILSTQACAVCPRCAYLDGQPCRFPEKMHPCVESHGINLIPTMEENGLDFQFGGNTVTWISLLFY